MASLAPIERVLVDISFTAITSPLVGVAINDSTINTTGLEVTVVAACEIMSLSCPTPVPDLI
jgi:hypothetical protein